MEVKGPTYRVWYDDASKTVHFEGSLRLNGVAEYAPIVELLDSLLASTTDEIRWDLTELEFLNSSGINVLYRHIIEARKKGGVDFKVRGTTEKPWQKKSLPNMKKFLPTLVLDLV